MPEDINSFRANSMARIQVGDESRRELFCAAGKGGKVGLLKEKDMAGKKHTEERHAAAAGDGDIETSLYEIYRALTSPANVDYDYLLEKIRWQLMQRGHDVDTWPAPGA